MDAQKLQHSSSSQSPARQNETQPISDAPEAKKTYPCSYCDKTFPTSMALGGHQNGHKMLRASAKRKAETLVHQPYPAVCASCSYCRAILALNQMRTDSIINKMESSGSSNCTWPLLDDFYAKMGQPQTTSAPPMSTMFSGVRDFLGSISAASAPPEENGSGNVINLDDEDEDAPELDLDLKL